MIKLITLIALITLFILLIRMLLRLHEVLRYIIHLNERIVIFNKNYLYA